MKSEKFITRDPEILGGIPVFTGTRVPVETLLTYLKSGGSLADFLADFPRATSRLFCKPVGQIDKKLSPAIFRWLGWAPGPLLMGVLHAQVDTVAVALAGDRARVGGAGAGVRTHAGHYRRGSRFAAMPGFCRRAHAGAGAAGSAGNAARITGRQGRMVHRTGRGDTHASSAWPSPTRWPSARCALPTAVKARSSGSAPAASRR